jgi:nitroimidazol reductase NimA-like FMN-containing flavoprotein (pyridoxamine 5'-phosphate oxidase superfamily)
MKTAKTERATIRRHADRAHYDHAQIHAILDAGLVAHVGFVTNGSPFVIPMVYARLGDEVLLHGARASRLQKTLAGEIPVCVTVTLLDGIVLARSAFHHSMNYRSVVLFGNARNVTDEAEKHRAFAALIDHVVPGRNARIRAADDAELRGTSVLAVKIDEAAAKIRTGPPIEEERDLPYPAWAGVIPLPVRAAPLVPAEGLDEATQSPDEYERTFVRG